MGWAATRVAEQNTHGRVHSGVISTLLETRNGPLAPSSGYG